MKRGLVNAALAVSVLLNLAFLGYLARSGGLRRIFLKADLVELPRVREGFQKEQEEAYRKLPNTSAEVVFAGDSLINEGPWAEFLSEIHNRGIGGDTTSGLLGRLDEVTESKPARVFLLVGTNDLAQAVPEAQLLRNYRAILERFSRESPKTIVTVLSLLPINPTPSKPLTQTNDEIASANQSLRKLVGEFPGVRYLDLTPLVADESGQLRRELTRDGIHLNLDGYLALRKTIQEAATR